MTSEFNVQKINSFLIAFLKWLAGSIFQKSIYYCNPEGDASLGLTVNLREQGYIYY